MMDIKEGTILVTLARRTISFYLSKQQLPKENYPDNLYEKGGVFVTLKSYPSKRLRGCIGFTEPVYPLVDALRDAAIASAVRDPRFNPLKREELDSITIEVTVLTQPKLMEVDDVKDYLTNIELGVDGLIVELGFNKGLLLPQVPIEWGWDIEEFISQTCVKAGLQYDAWKTNEELQIYTFRGEIFSEVSPGGSVMKGPKE